MSIAADQHFLYRGTSIDWQGGSTLNRLRLTCTSSDPLVATLFGIECLRHGEGVVQIAPRLPLNGLIGPSNVLSSLEREITLRLLPAEFENYVVQTISAAQARDILNNMGYELPERIGGYFQLGRWIEDTASRRLSELELADFNSQALNLP